VPDDVPYIPFLAETGLDDDRQPLIYLAGPYSAPDQHTRERKVAAAQHAADIVLSHGALPVYTHAAYHRFWGRYPESMFITLGLKHMRLCQGVWCYAGHEASMMSSGTQGECREAERIGIPWHYDLPGLLKWMKEVA
jgi:hypothetical protein